MALPPTSPRLPSPPPAAEIQIGPKSPAMPGATFAQQQMEQQMEQTILDANSKRRIHPGTRAADFAAGPPLVPLNELDSAFQLQEHLSALHYFHTASNTQAITRDTAHILAQPPVSTDRTLWLYELCRFLIAQCNSLIIGFLFDTPPCSAATCPEMRASEWQFLCAVHETPRSCCAIDYCCHTLDWAANVVTNPKIFPSRFAFADPHDKSAANKNLINVFRRLHRIFAHAWFQHRGVFWSVEGQTGLYVLFKTVCDMYDLLPAENYKLPPEAEGLDTAAVITSAAAAGSGDRAAFAAPSAAANSHPSSTENTPGLISLAPITDRKLLGFGAGAANNSQRPTSSGGGGALGLDLPGGEHSIGRNNTRRHIRSSPSTGSAVTTVLEQDEDSSPFAPSRPLSILQHADRLSMPLPRAVAVIPPQALAPAPPASRDESAVVSEPEAEAETGETNAEKAAEVAEVAEVDVAEIAETAETAEAAEELVTVEQDLPSDPAKEGEAPAVADEAAKEEDVPQDHSTPVTETEADAEPTTTEEPAVEATDAEVEAETVERLSNISAAEATTADASEKAAKDIEASEHKAVVTEHAADKEPNETTEEEPKQEPKSEVTASKDSKLETSSDATVPAPVDEEADKPSTASKTDPAGKD